MVWVMALGMATQCIMEIVIVAIVILSWLDPLKIVALVHHERRDVNNNKYALTTLPSAK